MRGFEWHHLAVDDSPFYRFAQLFALQVRFVPHRGFVLLLAVRGLVATSLTAMQATLVTGLELGTTDRAGFLVDLARNVLVFVAAGLAAVDATQHGQRCATVFALGSACRLQADVRLVAPESFVAAPRTILVILTALREEFCTLWTLHLLRCK